MADAITVPTSPAAGGQATAAWADSVATAIFGLNALIGARATTNASQSLAAATLTTGNNGGTAAWTATEDTSGFVSATGGSTTPITIPTGKAGLYIFGVSVLLSAAVAARLLAQPLVNGVQPYNYRASAYNDSMASACWPLYLAAGTTLGVQFFATTASTAIAGCQVFCYRLGD